jgi:hypothetical protein
MDFQKSKLGEIVSSAISGNLVELFFLKKTEKDVYSDCRLGIHRIMTWIDMVLKPDKNNHRMKLDKFVAAEQEFNTSTYGIKAMIDATIFVKDRNNL